MITQTKNIDVKILTATESIDDKFTPLPQSPHGVYDSNGNAIGSVAIDDTRTQP